MNPVPTFPLNSQVSYLDPAALMRIKLPELRVKEDWSVVLSRSQCAAGLVADAAGGRCVWRGAGFAFRTDAVYPGSPRRGSADPGLYSAAPLGLVWRGVEWRKMAMPVLQQGILVNYKAEAKGVTVEKVIGKLLEVVKV